MKVIKGADTRSIVGGKATDDGMKKVFLKISSKSCIGNDLKLDRNKDSFEHIRRESGNRAENRISVLIKVIDIGKIQVPEFIKDLPG